MQRSITLKTTDMTTVIVNTANNSLNANGKELQISQDLGLGNGVYAIVTMEDGTTQTALFSDSEIKMMY